MLVVAGVVFGASLALTFIMRRLAIQWKVIDQPGEERKVHQTPTPLLGGVAVILAVSLGVLVAWPQLVGGYLLAKHVVGVVAAGLVILIGGVLDDIYDLPPLKQIGFPIAASLIIVASGIGIDYITNPFGGVFRLDSIEVELFRIGELPYHFTVIADIFTVLWLMGMMYTTKFLDGLDGLVSGVTVIGAFILFGLSLSKEVFQPETATIALIAAMAFLGFLLLNWHPAKIFLGESGSLFAGFILGVLAIISGAKIATALLILGVPILDVLWVIVRRYFLEKRSPFQADRKHLHLRMIDIGMSHRQVVVLLYIFTIIFGTSSLFLQSRSKFIALVFMVVAMLVFGTIVVTKYQRSVNEKNTKQK